MKRIARGFTLVEIMVVVVIVGALTAFALPQYRDYVMQARLTDAFSTLSALHPSAEQYWSNERTFVGFGDAAKKRMPADTKNFTFAVVGTPTTTSLKIQATGIGQVAGFNYTIDQSGVRTSTTTWGNSTTCWVDGKGGKCSVQ